MSFPDDRFLKARPVKLPDDSWGAVVKALERPEPGVKVKVRTASGKEWVAKVGEILNHLEATGEWVCTTKRESKKDERPPGPELPLGIPSNPPAPAPERHGELSGEETAPWQSPEPETAVSGQPEPPVAGFRVSDETAKQETEELKHPMRLPGNADDPRVMAVFTVAGQVYLTWPKDIERLEDGWRVTIPARDALPF